MVSAVGHEIDHPLTDFVADYQAATPTGAGEAVVPNLVDLQALLGELRARAGRGLQMTVRRHRERLLHLQRRLRDPRRLIRDRWQGLDAREQRLQRSWYVHKRHAPTELLLTGS